MKTAAVETGVRGVMAKRNGGKIGEAFAKLTGGATGGMEQDKSSPHVFADFILDYENETLGAYLE